ncbi:hypothetical protein G6F60_011746 [Rhizopus arrhizus]|nr:hypothetical protein G6F60_011746 [Rhizopus arrhizus]
MKKQYVYLITFSLVFNFGLTKRLVKASIPKSNQRALGSVQGALRLGSTNQDLVPDASSEHPLVLSNLEDQPLCHPDHQVSPVKDLKVLPGYEYFVLTNQISDPKKIIMDKASHLLVVSANKGIYSIRMDKCGNANLQQILDADLFDEPLGNGLALYNQYLYMTTSKSMYRFPYSDGQHSSLTSGIKIMSNIYSASSIETPDVAIDMFGYAYIPRTVNELHDRLDPSHATIKRFDFRSIPENGYDFEVDGQVFSVGTNTRGLLGFDAQANLWGISGLFSTSFQRQDIGLDEEQSSSVFAEELNKYSEPAKSYGFPYCLTEHSMTSKVAKGLGGQWGHPMFMNTSFSLDDYCQDPSNNIPPAAPLAPNDYASSVHFYTGTFCSMGDLSTAGTSVGLPCNWTNTPVMANHGLEGQQAGHSVVHLPFDDLNHKPRWDKQPEILLEQSEPCLYSPCFSPFGLAHDNYGRLYVSSDETNEVIVFRRTYSETAAQVLTNIMEQTNDTAENIQPERKDEKVDKEKDEPANKEEDKVENKEDAKPENKEEHKKENDMDDKQENKKNEKDKQENEEEDEKDKERNEEEDKESEQEDKEDKEESKQEDKEDKENEQEDKEGKEGKEENEQDDKEDKEENEQEDKEENEQDDKEENEQEDKEENEQEDKEENEQDDKEENEQDDKEENEQEDKLESDEGDEGDEEESEEDYEEDEEDGEDDNEEDG